MNNKIPEEFKPTRADWDKMVGGHAVGMKVGHNLTNGTYTGSITEELLALLDIDEMEALDELIKEGEFDV